MIMYLFLSIGLIVLSVLIIGVWVLWRQGGKIYQQLSLRNYAEYSRRYEAILVNFPNDIKASTFNLKGRPDYEQIMRFMRVYVDLSYEEWYLSKQGLVGRKMWESWKMGVEAMFSRPAFQQAWLVIKQDSKYGTDFAAFLEQYGHHDNSNN
jgi:polyphosphate kinase 2 (PPK2 family)